MNIIFYILISLTTLSQAEISNSINQIKQLDNSIDKTEKIDIHSILNAQSIVESNNNPNAIGDTKFKSNYSVGLHQIRIKTARWIIKNKMIVKNGKMRFFLQLINKIVGTKKMLLNPHLNRYIAKCYLEYLYYKTENWNDAIISYNTGLYASDDIKNSLGMKYLKKIKKEM